MISVSKIRGKAAILVSYDVSNSKGNMILSFILGRLFRFKWPTLLVEVKGTLCRIQ